MVKYLITKILQYIFIILASTIFLLLFYSKSFSEENVFTIDEVKVNGTFDINFSREEYIDKVFLESYKMLMSKILLSSDFNKLSLLSLNRIKNLISNFQILNETYINGEYIGTYKVYFNEKKVKKFLNRNNVSFSQPKKIIAIFYPVLFIDNKLQDFTNNYFYKYWNEIKIKNELISFILPIEDLDDVYKIKKMKNSFEELNIKNIVEKYNIDNYAFAFIENENNKLNVYLKTNFNKNKISKNISYKNFDINNKKNLKNILKDLKIKVTDIWKKENEINLSSPLSLNIKFINTKPNRIDIFKDTLDKINTIDNYFIEEININYAFIKIFYYGNPKKLTEELLKFSYELKNDQGRWVVRSE